MALRAVRETEAEKEPEKVIIPGPQWLRGFLHEALRHPGNNLLVAYNLSVSEVPLVLLAATRRGLAVVRYNDDQPDDPDIFLLEWIAVTIQVSGGKIIVHCPVLPEPATVIYQDRFHAQDFVERVSKLRWP